MRFTHDDKAARRSRAIALNHRPSEGPPGDDLIRTHGSRATGQPEERSASGRHHRHFYLLKRRLAAAAALTYLPGLRNAICSPEDGPGRTERSPTNTSRRSSLPPGQQRGSLKAQKTAPITPFLPSRRHPIKRPPLYFCCGNGIKNVTLQTKLLLAFLFFFPLPQLFEFTRIPAQFRRFKGPAGKSALKAKAASVTDVRRREAT